MKIDLITAVYAFYEIELRRHHYFFIYYRLGTLEEVYVILLRVRFIQIYLVCATYRSVYMKTIPISHFDIVLMSHPG